MATNKMKEAWKRDFGFLLRFKQENQFGSGLKTGWHTLDPVYRMIVAIAVSATDIERMVRMLPKNCQLLPTEIGKLKAFWKQFGRKQKPVPVDQRLCQPHTDTTEWLLEGMMCKYKSLGKYYIDKIEAQGRILKTNSVNQENKLFTVKDTELDVWMCGFAATLYDRTVDLRIHRVSKTSVRICFEMKAFDFDEPWTRAMLSRRTPTSFTTKGEFFKGCLTDFCWFVSSEAFDRELTVVEHTFKDTVLNTTTRKQVGWQIGENFLEVLAEALEPIGLQLENIEVVRPGA